MMKKYFHGTGGMTSEEAGEMSEKLYFAWGERHNMSAQGWEAWKLESLLIGTRFDIPASTDYVAGTR